MKRNIQKNKGFALLFTVMISSIILAITLGVSNIAFKEVKFGTSTREANEAFFAADTGIECALANDKFGSNSFASSGGSGVVTCLGGNIALTDASHPSFAFIVTGLGIDADGCAVVSVYKDAVSNPPNVITTIVSKGYNFGNASCTSTSPNRIEREVEVVYGYAPAVEAFSFTRNLSTVTAGSSITVSWTGLNTMASGPQASNWIGLYPPNVNDYGYLEYIYAGTCSHTSSTVPSSSGSCSFTIPPGTPPGASYTFKLFEDVPPSNGLTSTSTFTVQ